MYLNPTNKYWAIDIEGDLIPSTRVYCVCAVNAVTKEEVTLLSYEEIKDWFAEGKKEGRKYIGHNIIGYDAPTLNRICGTRLVISDLVDTMLLSMLYSPSIDGGHGLEAWGVRLKSPKLDFKDFSAYSEEMRVYCLQDTYLCLLVFLELSKRMSVFGFTDTGLDIEHRSWQLIQQQQIAGFPFNIKEAHVLYALLREKENEIRDKLYEHWPPVLTHTFTGKQRLKKNGSPTANYERHRQQYEKVIPDNDGGYLCFEYVAFNIGSPDQRIRKLIELGWVPQEFTKKTDKGGGGNPQPTVKGQLAPSLVAFVEASGRPEPRLIADWIEINSRANMINTWMEAYNERTGRIHGSLWLANTLRYKHSAPNTANIPAVRVRTENKGTPQEVDVPLRGQAGVYTYEARDLWVTSDPIRRRLVGVDAKGIQLRVLAHYLNNKDFTDAVLSGDPHSYNQDIGGFGSRAIAKTFIYAFLLGAGDAKVGQIIGESARVGKAVKARFIGNFPGLKQLLDDLDNQIRATGRIRLCDGTPLIVSKPHTRLGYLLQGDESRIMKKASILVAKEVQRRRLDVVKVGDIHDEWQNDVLLRDVPEFTDDVNPPAFRTTGEFFHYRLPVECDCKVGLTWAETH